MAITLPLYVIYKHTQDSIGRVGNEPKWMSESVSQLPCTVKYI